MICYKTLIVAHDRHHELKSSTSHVFLSQHRINVSCTLTGLLSPILFLEALKHTLGRCMQPTLNTLDEAFRPSSLGIRHRIQRSDHQGLRPTLLQGQHGNPFISHPPQPLLRTKHAVFFLCLP